MKTTNTPTETVNTNKTTINTADRLTAKRLHEYGKRHGLTPDAQNLVSYLYINGPSKAEAIMQATGLTYHDKFFAALCVANGLLILDKRAITVDVNLTSRQAIRNIPESVFAAKPAAPPVDATVATGPRPSAGDPGGEVATLPAPNKEDPAPVATETPTNEADDQAGREG